ncbi:MAG: hypothetical protein LZF60_20248 [Nitrospira sp.]|nr:MAG: hypothetical protein LZF60_20248 [Nitrospira sp.]
MRCFEVVQWYAEQMRRLGPVGHCVGEMGMERTMTSLNYCRSCFKRLLVAASASDQLHLKELIGSWSPVRPVSLANGLCGRCGREGEVLKYEIIP